MPDLDDLFQSSIELQASRSGGAADPHRTGGGGHGDDTGPMLRPDAGRAELAAGSRSGGVALDERPVDPEPPVPAGGTGAADDDLLIDLRQLVTEWNARHEAGPAGPATRPEPVDGGAADTVAGGTVPAPPAGHVGRTDPPARRRARLEVARHVLAEHIGAQPTQRVEPPPGAGELAEGAEGTGAAATGGAGEADAREETGSPAPKPILRPADVAASEAPDAGDAEAHLLPTRSRQVRRRARREADRLVRECRRLPAPEDGADEVDDVGGVTLLGRAPDGATTAPAASVGDPPAPLGATTVPAGPAPAIRGIDDVVWADSLVVAPGESSGERVPAAPSEAGEDGAAVARRTRGRRARRPMAADGPVRFPILTRSVLVWLFIFMVAGLAFGASAAFWWSHFNSEVDAIRSENSAFTEQVQGASAAVENQRRAALDEIDSVLADAERLQEPAFGPSVAAAAGPSVFLLETRDEAGAAVVGSAFVVGNDPEAGTSLLLTSLDVVGAATTAPGPAIHLRQGDRQLDAELWSWDRDTDLAVLVVDVPDLPALPWVSDEEAGAAVGSTVFSVAGLGGQGASATPGWVVDQTLVGLQHTAPVGTAYRGGPLLTADGKVLGVASLALQPLDFDPGEVHFASTIGTACGGLLRCGEGAPTAPGEQGGEALPAPEGEEDAPPAG